VSQRSLKKTIRLRFALKVDPIRNEPDCTGNAGALARYEREARNSNSIKKVEIERVTHAVRARAPALPVLSCLFLPHFLGKTIRLRFAKVFAVGIALLAIAQLFALIAAAQKRRAPPGGHLAIVADERLAALRKSPEPTARLLHRLSRGRLVSIRATSRSRDGLTYHFVAVTRRTSGWLQSEAVIASWRPGDDQRLIELIEGDDEFDRVARARIFLDAFPRSPARAQVLMLFGNAAEAAARKLSREVASRFRRNEIPEQGAPEFSYYLNYSGLDRYNRQGVVFVFDRASKQFHYDGAAWREIIRRYPKSPEAAEARKRIR